MYVCICARVCVWLTSTSSFSESNIIVLDWGVYKYVCVYICGCVCVCVANTHVRTSSFSESNIIVLDWGAYKYMCVCACVRAFA